MCCFGTRTASRAEEGERWFLETHAPEVCELPGLRRFFSYRVIDEPVRLPGVWRDGGTPPPETVQHEWHRLSELWFDSFSDWRRPSSRARPR